MNLMVAFAPRTSSYSPRMVTKTAGANTISNDHLSLKRDSVTRLSTKGSSENAMSVESKIASPPTRGIALLCTRRSSLGTSSQPNLTLSRLIIGVKISDEQRAMTKSAMYVFMMGSPLVLKLWVQLESWENSRALREDFQVGVDCFRLIKDFPKLPAKQS